MSPFLTISVVYFVLASTDLLRLLMVMYCDCILLSFHRLIPSSGVLSVSGKGTPFYSKFINAAVVDFSDVDLSRCCRFDPKEVVFLLPCVVQPSSRSGNVALETLDS